MREAGQVERMVILCETDHLIPSPVSHQAGFILTIPSRATRIGHTQQLLVAEEPLFFPSQTHLAFANASTGGFVSVKCGISYPKKTPLPAGKISIYYPEGKVNRRALKSWQDGAFPPPPPWELGRKTRKGPMAGSDCRTCSLGQEATSS